jgi:hypothetical protein
MDAMDKPLKSIFGDTRGTGHLEGGMFLGLLITSNREFRAYCTVNLGLVSIKYINPQWIYTT